MQILKKTANMRDDVCYRVTSQSKVTDVNKEFVERMVEVSEMLNKDDKSVSNIEDLGRASTMSNERKMVRVRKLDESQAGFVSIGSVTIIGTLFMIMSILAAVKMLVVK